MVTGSFWARHRGAPNCDREFFCYAQGGPKVTRSFSATHRGVPNVFTAHAHAVTTYGK